MYHPNIPPPPSVVFPPQNLPSTSSIPYSNVYPPVQPSFQFHMPPFSVNSFQPEPVVCQAVVNESQTCRMSDEDLVKEFLTKTTIKPRIRINGTTAPMKVAEFRGLLKEAVIILRELAAGKEVLKSLLDSDDETWNYRFAHARALQSQLFKICSRLSSPGTLSGVLVKLKRIEKKRKRIHANKEFNNHLKKTRQQQQLMLHQKTDQWLETLREKDLQQKRESEMKKEADSILSEVRKKIQEGKRTIEKLKIFQKLRQARRENAVKKGMFLLSKHDQVFDSKISELKETMLRQLSDYEAEEKALKVMLETEQEGQREAEAEWKLKQMRKQQEKKFANILQCLFGQSDPPSPTDPMYFFWQYYDAANHDINALMKVRHEWDMFLVPRDSTEGTSIPSRWVVPEAPSSKTWAQALVSNAKTKT